MTPQKFIISKYGKRYFNIGISISDTMDLMEAYAMFMCDKQKEICAEQYNQGKEFATHDIYIVNYISDAPYPDELQGNN